MFAGDHVPWHSPLDGSESRIQHMLMAEDPQLNPITTSFGPVCFVQVTSLLYSLNNRRAIPSKQEFDLLDS